MNLSFTADDDVLDCVVFESTSGSPVYQLETPKYSGSVLTTTVSRCDGSPRSVFKILWAGTSMEHAKLVLNFATRTKCKARDVLHAAHGSSAYGALTINNIQYKWKAKGVGSKLVLVNSNTKAVAAESHRQVTSSGSLIKTKTPRCMNLDIADEVVDYIDLILLTFLLVWKERVGERAKRICLSGTPDLTSVVSMGSR